MLLLDAEFATVRFSDIPLISPSICISMYSIGIQMLQNLVHWKILTLNVMLLTSMVYNPSKIWFLDMEGVVHRVFLTGSIILFVDLPLRLPCQVPKKLRHNGFADNYMNKVLFLGLPRLLCVFFLVLLSQCLGSRNLEYCPKLVIRFSFSLLFLYLLKRKY